MELVFFIYFLLKQHWFIIFYVSCVHYFSTSVYPTACSPPKIFFHPSAYLFNPARSSPSGNHYSVLRIFVPMCLFLFGLFIYLFVCLLFIFPIWTKPYNTCLISLSIKPSKPTRSCKCQNFTFLWLSSIPWYIYVSHFLYTIIYWWVLNLFPYLACSK